MAHIPAPFKRKSIDLTRHGRVWRQVRADEIRDGDRVRGRGLVSGRTEPCRGHVSFVLEGERVICDVESRLMAFVLKESGR